MTTRAKVTTALRIAQEGLPTRARMNKFGWSEAYFRLKKKHWDWAVRVLERHPCAAKRRSDGKPCQALNEPGKRRCKWHGGLSTGPRTAEGKARALANLKQYSERERSAARRRRKPMI